MRRLFVLLSVIAVFYSLSAQNANKKDCKTDYTNFVNPFVGNAFTGHTFPGATYPLGLVQPGPETGNNTWAYCSGYVYEDTHINGFSQTRLNGTGCVDLGDILIQPFSGKNRDGIMKSTYSKTSEKASAGYYAVDLTENDVKVQITAAPHVAFHKYTFPKNKEQNILADFQNGLSWSEDQMNKHILASDIKFENSRTISGYIRRTMWIERIVYFVIEFDKPIVKKELLKQRHDEEKAPRYVLSFGSKGKEDLNMKIALSSTSVEGAKANLRAEVNHWDFNKTHKEAINAWNNILSRVEVGGTNDEKSNIYTSLYHLFIQPNNIADVDGRYIGPNRKISKSTSGKYYSTWSQWDIFRAGFPFYTIVSPELIPDFVNSMLDYSEQQGHLPVWSLWGQETYTMIGNHSVPMVADAYLKGFKGFDPQRAFREIKKSLTQTTYHKTNWDVYDKYGYYPFDLIKLESVSRTLECGFDDYSAAQMAKKLGKKEDYNFFKKRSNYYKNLFDTETNTMRPKDSKGNWITPFDPYELAHADSQVGGNYTEANALQYTWHVLQDIPGLIQQMGGKEKAGKLLDYLFNTQQESTGKLSDVTGLIGQYAHGNEPSHHIAYIYNYLDRPQDAQKLIRQITDGFYKNKPDGLIGNDDCGQMSAWYMFSVLGFYPVNPVSGEFVIGAPQIPYAKINVGNGKYFTMEAKKLSKENMYIEKIELNGKIINSKTISYKDIMNGGNIKFYMTNQCNLK